MDDDNNLVEDMNLFNSMVDQLAKADITIEEKYNIFSNFSSSSYDNLVNTVSYGKTIMKMEEIVSFFVP